ncbi:glycosyltransferase family 9 protein [Zemynaea arenosa]|uniref:glycosyltransferase family 9 protein n=1 Tax=Zemynaea arenosa TaxID=2561931 RepID=UPI0014308578|nr:glycosyltransferase family 9 protein [Massilia arenosa]
MSIKVLFFSHDSKLGDAIVNTAFVAGLKRLDPACEIHATVAGVTDAFWAQDARVARRWTYAIRSWKHAIQLALALRRERFDYIVTWLRPRSEKNKLLLWLARPGRVIDLDEFNRGPVQHKVAACREALAQMGRRCDGELAYDVRAEARCAQLDAAFASGQEVIVVNLFAADAERNVSLADAVTLVRGLHAQAPDAALCLPCCGAHEAQAREVVAQSGVGEVVSCEGNLARLFRLCQRADLVVSPDTAVVHIASAFDRPVIGIYQNNGIKPVQWGPRSRASAIVLSKSAQTLDGFSIAEVLLHARHLRAASDTREPATA